MPLALALALLIQDDPEKLRQELEETKKRVAEIEKKLDAGNKPTNGLKLDVPLLESLTIGGQVRLRGEFRDVGDYRLPGTFGRPATDRENDSADAVFMRTRLQLDAAVNRHLRAFIQLQDSRVWGEEPSLAADTADIDLKQGFLEVREICDAPLSIKAGRMELPMLGDQRLISPLDWSNVGRSWDGLHVTYAPEKWSLQAFVVYLGKGGFSFGSATEERVLAGLYGSCRAVPNHEFDVYLFPRWFTDDAFTSELGGSPRRKQDYTFGFRAKGKVEPFDYSGEAAFQFGSQGGDDERAWALAIMAGFTLDCDWKPRIGIEYAFASGDEDPADGRAGTFDPLFPFGHYFHGHMDLVGWRNIHAFMVSLRAQPLAVLSLHLDVHAFRLAEDRDAWYGAAGTAIRRDPAGSAGPFVGTEFDLYAKWKLWERLEIWAGYSHFFPGAFVQDTGSSEAQDWIFLQVTLNL